MQPLTVEEIKNAVSGELITGNPRIKVENICTDSRKIAKGDLFIALIGEKFDGHHFAREAVEKGADGLIIDRKVEIDSDREIFKILVNNTTKALQDLANYYRNQFEELKVIGITGSSGKTTTKDMLAGVLKEKYSILKTEENLNNQIGVPLTLLSLQGKEEFAVIEMGMSASGEIRTLARIAEPQIGVITNVGPAHLQDLKTIQNVAGAKGELIAELPEDSLAVLNYDNEYVREMKEKFKGNNLIYFGFNKKADIRAVNVNDNEQNVCFTVQYQNQKKDIKLNIPGKHNVYNALSVIAIAREFNIGWEDIQKGLLNFDLTTLRMEIIENNDIVIINDAYNANPLSMKAGIDVLCKIAKSRSFAVLGDMLELGDIEKEAHRKVGHYVADKNIDFLITVGKLGQLIAKGAKKKGMNAEKVIGVKNNKMAAEILTNHLKKNDSVLVKGSRSMGMEEIVELIIKK